MFDRIKKAFAKEPKAVAFPEPQPESAYADVSDWAGRSGFEFSIQGSGFALDGPVAGKACRIETGRASRKYIEGLELRGRAELDIHPDVLLVLMNRPLKESLEKQAYALYTDTLQTSVDRNLPEEMRLLAMYDEVGWPSLQRAFWDRYAVVGEDRKAAMAWMDDELARQLLEWPAPAPGPNLPFMMMLLRGKAYLRMQYSPALLPKLQHAVRVFGTACENALKAFPRES